MKIVELQEKCLGGLFGTTHYYADGKRIYKSQFQAIKDEAIQHGEYLNDWNSDINGVTIFGQYVKIRDDFNY